MFDLKTNRNPPPNYRKLYRADQPISIGWVESTVNEIIAERMVKKQQMRWNGFTVQLFLTVLACPECHVGTSLQNMGNWLPVGC